VFARHNAVDIEARLPDGSGSALSVSAILQRRSVHPPATGNGNARGDR
jgi:NADH-quinone oxidoreductase subunit J